MDCVNLQRSPFKHKRFEMSDFWVRKIRTFFRIFDYNKDGLVTIADFEQLAQRYGEGFDEERQQTVRETLRQLFLTFDATAGGTGTITEDEMIEGAVLLRTEPKYKDVLRNVAEVCYAMLDSDSDGIMHVSDHVRLFYNHNIPDHEASAKAAFAELDTNHDGALDFEDVSNGFYDYLLSDDESLPNKIFFGPLAEIEN